MTDKDRKSLHKICGKLPYSMSGELTDDIFTATVTDLRDLFSQYDYAKVLGELSSLWPLDKAIPFFTKMNLKTNSFGEVKTIATHHRRAYHGGIERVNAQLITLLTQMGYKVIFFTEEPENELDYPYPKEVKRIIIPTSANLTDRLITIRQHCIDEKVDLYINHHWENPSILWECVILKMIHIPFIQYVHGHFAWSIADSRINLYQPDLYKLCDVVLSLSETSARFYQLCGCNSYLVQNPVPEDLSVNTELSKLNTNHILMVGRLSPVKRPMESLKVFELVHGQIPSVILDVVGGDDETFIPQMQAYIKKRNLDGSVIFHGKKTQSEIAEFYKNSDCVLLTSEMESYSMVALESKAYGLPLAMYELPYLSLVKDEKGIVTAPIGDINTLADKIIHLMQDDAYRMDMGLAARDSFNSFNTYDFERTWNNIIKLCSFGEQSIDDPSYFNPVNVSYSDKFIEPMLLDSIKKGYKTILTTSRDYQIGYKALKLPRLIKRILAKMKKTLIHGK